ARRRRPARQRGPGRAARARRPPARALRGQDRGRDARGGGRPRAARPADGRAGGGCAGGVIEVRVQQRSAPARWVGLAVAPAAVAVTFLLTLGFVLAAGASPLRAYDTFIVDPLTTRFS